MAVGFSLLAAALTAGLALHEGVEVTVSAPVLLGLVATAAAAELVVVQLGPRSWYTASTPAVVLAGLLGGPLAGAAAGAAAQALRSEAVWRRRLAEGGLATLQGIAAGAFGQSAWSSGWEATRLAVVAMAAAVVINTIGRLLVMLERKAEPLLALWRRGFIVDCLETALVVPVLAALLITARTSAGLVVITMAAALAGLGVAKRGRDSSEAALAIEQSNARRDQLTGAPNRRAFEEALAAEHSRIVRGGSTAGVLVVDLDRFKSINDSHGHHIGDRVLVEVVRRLTDGLRPSDVVARWGGEEIAVLAPLVRGRRQLEQLGERVRVLVGERPVETGLAGLGVAVTVSVGATLLDGSIRPQAAFERADAALYEAKRTRDAVAVTVSGRESLRLESA